MDVTQYIKEIGRGKDGARSLSRDEAYHLFHAMLKGEISELQLGAIWIAMRIKGESNEELAGFLSACEESYPHLNAPRTELLPIVIPTYNGARRMANLVPLLALLLAREGVPVLVQGIEHDPKRITTYEIFQAMGLNIATTIQEAEAQLEKNKPAFFSINALFPALARLLEKRWQIGVRSSAHTLAKMLQPFRSEALRLVNVTHPDYLTSMRDFFISQNGNVLLMRGTEGEAIASYKHLPTLEWVHKDQSEIIATAYNVETENPDIPSSKEADVTAQWIQEVLAGKHNVPEPIKKQLACCLKVVHSIKP